MRISDWSSDVCSSDLPVARGLAQRVKRGVMTLGDITALRRVDRRGFDQRARQFIDERTMAVEAGEQPCEQGRSEEHTSELQSLMRISYAVFCLKKKRPAHRRPHSHTQHQPSAIASTDSTS